MPLMLHIHTILYWFAFEIKNSHEKHILEYRLLQNEKEGKIFATGKLEGWCCTFFQHLYGFLCNIHSSFQSDVMVSGEKWMSVICVLRWTIETINLLGRAPE